MKGITKTVWILSLVSLFTDTASEMLYPIMPVYLKSIGFSVVLIGVLEGFAEAIAGLSKGYFGNLSDAMGRRVPFVQLGYFLSALSRPLLAVSVIPLWVFFSRTLDRLGKGIRTGARDAILSDEATPQTKAKVFGFHRAMDTTGAVLGPALALIYLHFYPQNYKALFLIAIVPGLLAFLSSVLLKEASQQQQKKDPRPAFLSFIKYWKEAKPEYRALVGSLLLFTFFNSSDVFLLLKVKQAGVSDETVITIYIFFNLIYALFSYPLGSIADKIGLKKMFLIGLLLFSIVYLGMGVNSKPFLFFVLFFLYGIYMAASEGIVKAWISNISEKHRTATAIGTFTAFQSVMSILSSSFAGFIWFQFGASTTFFVTGIASILIMILVYAKVPYYSTIESKK
jgi:MFS family permease